jgi:hypothetical protein
MGKIMEYINKDGRQTDTPTLLKKEGMIDIDMETLSW